MKFNIFEFNYIEIKIMEIQYLKYLEKHPQGRPSDPVNIGMTETEIAALETQYNNGDPFPKVLKELLFLAGKQCYAADYGFNDDAGELQSDVRNILSEANDTIDEPFFAFEVVEEDQFAFIYLNEDDPNVYLYCSYAESIGMEEITDSGKTASKFILDVAIRVVSGGPRF